MLLGGGDARSRGRLPVGAEAERAPADGAVDREQADAVDAQQAGGRQRLPGQATALGDAQARHVLALAVGRDGLDVGDFLAEVLVGRGVERGVDGEDEDVAAAQDEVLEERAWALLGAVAGDSDDLGADALVELGLADREADERALFFFFFFALEKREVGKNEAKREKRGGGGEAHLVANDSLDQLGVGREQRSTSSLLEQSERGLRSGVATAGAPAKGLGRLERRQQRTRLGARGGAVGGHGHERQALLGGQGRGHADILGEEEGVSREEQEVGVDGVRLLMRRFWE